MINMSRIQNDVDCAREQALLILYKVFQNKSYSNILIKNLGQKFSALDRAFISEIVYGTIKWRLRIDYIISQLSSMKLQKISPYIMNILRLGIYQIEFMDRVPHSAAVDECVKLSKKYGSIGASKFVNGVLRNYIRRMETIAYPEKEENPVKYLSVYYSYPEWMVSKLMNEFGFDFTEDFLKSGNFVPPVTVRVNCLKTDKKSLMDSLKESGIDVSSGKYMDASLSLKGVPGIEWLKEYKNGFLTVQDESSMLAVQVLSPKPGDLIMDVCSAPGTKSTYMAELMGNKGTIISGDISEGKLKLVNQNAERLGIDIIKTIVNDASKTMDEYIDKADRVIVDAPCSGLGIMRKKPEIRWNREASDLKAITGLQSAILYASSKYVKPGGILVYSTCTVLREENINIVKDFLKYNCNFMPEDITELIPDKLKRDTCSAGYIELYPNTDNIDGFFIARMKRVK